MYSNVLFYCIGLPRPTFEFNLQQAYSSRPKKCRWRPNCTECQLIRQNKWLRDKFNCWNKLYW